MEVILLEDVKGLGAAGETKRVADGYARNYLFPRGLATPASESARKAVSQRVAVEARKESQAKAQAEITAEALQDKQLVFEVRAGEGGKLYGAITSGDIAERLSELLGEAVDKRKVLLEDPIRELGTTAVDVKLHSDVKISVDIVVTREAS